MTRNKYERSDDYRYEYIRHNPGKNGKYHCSYCGKMIKKEDMQVDHIFSVHNAKNHISTRLLMKLFGINGVNDVKNLTASCKKCNMKKGKMGNGWIIRGFLGKSIWYHRMRRFIKLCILCLICYMIYKMLLHYEIDITKIGAVF